MELNALTYDLADRTWSGPLPDTDSERTLLLAVGAPAPLAMADLRRAFPRSIVVGCGSSGGGQGDLAVTIVRFDSTRVRTIVVPRSTARSAADHVEAELASPELRAILLLGPDTLGAQAELASRLGGVAVVAEQPHGSGLWVASGTSDTARSFVAVALYGPALVLPEAVEGGPDLLLVTLAEEEGYAPVEERPKFTVRTAAWDARVGAWTSRLPSDLDSPKTFVLAFGPGDASLRAPLDELRAVFARSTVIGCSSAGQILGAEVRDGVLTVAVVRLAEGEIVAANDQLSGAFDPGSTGAGLARLLNRPNLRAVFVIAEGDGAEALVAELGERLPPHVIIAGGVAAGPSPWLLAEGRVGGGRVTALGLVGEHVLVTQNMRGGWLTAGPERKVTRAEGAVVHQLDTGLALELARDDLAQEGHDVAAGQVFAFRDPDGVLVFRAVEAYDEGQGSITFSGDVQLGATAVLVRAAPADLVRAAEQASADALADRKALAGRVSADPGADVLAFAVSGAGRRAVLGPRAIEEAEACRRALGGIPVFGFYARAQVAVVAPGRVTLQDPAFVITTVSEMPEPVAPRAPKPVPQELGAVERAARPEAPRRPQPRAEARPEPAAGLTVRSLSVDDLSRPFAAPGDLDSVSTLVLAAGNAHGGGPEAMRVIARQLPSSHVIGISGRPRGIAFIAARFAGSTLTGSVTAVPDLGKSYDAGRRLAASLAHPRLRAVLVFGRVDAVRGSELVRGINDALGPDVVLAGALAPRGGWVSYQGAEQSGVVAVGLAGDGLQVGYAARGGVDPSPPERLIGRANGPAVYEIDGRPAAALIRPPPIRASGPSGFGYAFLRADDPDRRHRVVAIDERTKSILVDPPLATGTAVHLLRDEALWLPIEVREAATGAVEGVSAPGGFALALASPSRYTVAVERDFTIAEGVFREAGATPFACTVAEVLGRGVGPDAPTVVVAFAEDAAAKPAEAPPPAAGDDKRKPAVRPAPAAQFALRASTFPDAGREAGGVEDEPTLNLVPPVLPPEEPRRPAPAPRPAATHRPAPVASAPPRASAVPASARTAAALGVDRKTVGGFEIAALGGRITESFQGERLGRDLSGPTILDLGRVERITSFGVREWLAMLRASRGRAEPLFLTRCTEPFVNQLTMIRGFSGHGQIVSFFAPYTCATCGTSYSALLDAEHDRASLLAMTAPPSSCPRCGGEGTFDEEESSYFSLVAHLAEEVPAGVRAAVTSLEPVVQVDPIEKVVDDAVTRLTVSAAVDGATRWAQALDGVEGQLVVDFSRSPAASPEGAENLERALRAVIGDVQSVSLVSAPRFVVDRLVRAAHLPKLEIWSMVADAHCAQCAAGRTVVVTLADHAQRLARGDDPDVPCPKCGNLLAFDASRMLLAAAAERSLPGEPSSAGPVPMLLGPIPKDPSELVAWTQNNSRSLAPMVAVGVTSAVVAVVLFTLMLVGLYFAWLWLGA